MCKRRICIKNRSMKNIDLIKMNLIKYQNELA